MCNPCPSALSWWTQQFQDQSWITRAAAFPVHPSWAWLRMPGQPAGILSRMTSWAGFVPWALVLPLPTLTQGLYHTTWCKISNICSCWWFKPPKACQWWSWVDTSGGRQEGLMVVSLHSGFLSTHIPAWLNCWALKMMFQARSWSHWAGCLLVSLWVWVGQLMSKVSTLSGTWVPIRASLMCCWGYCQQFVANRVHFAPFGMGSLQGKRHFICPAESQVLLWGLVVMKAK